MTTTPQPSPSSSSSSSHPPSERAEEPFLSLHSAVVLIGIVVGVLAHLGGTPPASAVLAGLAAAGASVPVLRALIR